MPDANAPRYVFHEGDHALIFDRRGRRYLVRLAENGMFESHLGYVKHADLIGRDEGARVKTSRGHWLLAVKPTMADFTREMPRIATIVYPKDLGAILTYADIFPGATVLEAGAGSGAVTILLARAVGPSGRVVSYDLRADMLKRAKANVEAFVDDASQVVFKEGDVSDSFDERALDRIVLDLPEPWHVVPHASEALVPGGILLSFLPTVPQVQQVTQALKDDGNFDLIETLEMIMRPWSVAGRSVRPAQRMVAHTGFITTARKCEPRPRQKENGEKESE